MENNTDKEKIDYQHKLEIRRLVIDKFLFAIVIVLIGFLTNMIIENYRNKLTAERFWLEKKYTAVKEVREAFGKMHDYFMASTIYYYKGNLTDDYSKEFFKHMLDYVSTGNTWGAVLSPKFNHELQNYLWIYQAFQNDSIANCIIYRNFAADLQMSFNSICRKELEIYNTKCEKTFVFIESKLDECSVGDFLKKNYQKWKTTMENHD